MTGSTKERYCCSVHAGGWERYVFSASPVDSSKGAAACHHYHLCQQDLCHLEGELSQACAAVLGNVVMPCCVHIQGC